MKRTLIITITICLLLALFVCWARSCRGTQKVEGSYFSVSRIYTGARADVWAARFDPSDSVIATASVDSTVRIWSRASGALLHELHMPGGATNLSFSNDGQLLAASAYDGKLRVWNWRSGQLLQTLAAQAGTVWSLQFSPNGKILAACGEDASIVLFSVPDGKLLNTLRGHTRNVWDLAFSPDGTLLASGSFDGTLRLWHVPDGKTVQILSGHTEAVVSLAWSADGKRLASTSDDKTVRIWNTQSWKTELLLKTPEHQQGVSFSSDGQRLLTSGRDKDMIGELLQNFLGDETTNKGVSMRLWDAHSGALLQTFDAHANDVNDVQFSRDGNWALSASSDKTVILWKKNG